MDHCKNKLFLVAPKKVNIFQKKKGNPHMGFFKIKFDRRKCNSMFQHKNSVLKNPLASHIQSIFEVEREH